MEREGYAFVVVALAGAHWVLEEVDDGIGAFQMH